MAKQIDVASMTLAQKMSEIAKMCGVLQRDKKAYGYKYVEESTIQAHLTAGLQKYHVILKHDLVPGTLKVIPYTYEKYDKDLKANKPVNEFIVTADTTYTWINADNPTEQYEGTYAMVGMQDDPSMAFGSAETYCNRYYLLKMLQIATTEDDPDNWRSKQREAADREETEAAKAAAEALKAAIKLVVDKGTKIINEGGTKKSVQEAVAKHNGGNSNPSSLPSVEACEAVLAELETIIKKKEN